MAGQEDTDSADLIRSDLFGLKLWLLALKQHLLTIQNIKHRWRIGHWLLLYITLLKTFCFSCSRLRQPKHRGEQWRTSWRLYLSFPSLKVAPIMAESRPWHFFYTHTHTPHPAMLPTRPWSSCHYTSKCRDYFWLEVLPCLPGPSVL